MTGLIKETHTITPRRPKFDFKNMPTHWIYDDPMTTQVLNVINPLTPAPERWFCQTFRDALPYIQDEKLKEAAIAFIKQEGIHSHGHTLSNRRIEDLGIDLNRYSKMLSWLFNDMIGPKPLGYKLTNPRLISTWLKTRLAMVAAAEHLTGALGHWVLNANGLKTAPIDPQMFHLLKWHAAEEVEHREVADAMFRHFSDSIILRTGAALVTFPLLVLLAYVGVEYLVKQDNHLPYRFRFKDYFRAARQDRVPSVDYMIRVFLRYFHPNYSPLHEGSTEQALAYLNNMPDFKYS